MAGWNPWHGCHKLSEGCRHCYVYRIDERHGRDSSVVSRNKDFDLPIRRSRSGEYKIKAGETVYTCFSSDFFVEDADDWRLEAWDIMRQRPDLHFFMITKRIDRFEKCIPADWGSGYENVTVCCTVENQRMADYRLPIYLSSPIRHKCLACEPLLEGINLARYLESGEIKNIVCGGESGLEARPCRYEWVLSLRQQCAVAGIGFYFKQTGAHFVKDGKQYTVPRKLQHSQAKRAGINITMSNQEFYVEDPDQAVLDEWE
ncbi:MAG: DUF5131 family protein [Clostridiaceae bacterium]|nr:DUF5131 family protein [Clostridiaceae bacterium]